MTRPPVHSKARALPPPSGPASVPPLPVNLDEAQIGRLVTLLRAYEERDSWIARAMLRGLAGEEMDTTRRRRALLDLAAQARSMAALLPIALQSDEALGKCVIALGPLRKKGA